MKQATKAKRSTAKVLHWDNSHDSIGYLNYQAHAVSHRCPSCLETWRAMVIRDYAGIIYKDEDAIYCPKCGKTGEIT